MGGRGSGLTALWRRLGRISESSVDDGVAVCEFECNESQCTLGDWERCENRRHASARPEQGDASQ